MVSWAMQALRNLERLDTPGPNADRNRFRDIRRGSDTTQHEDSEIKRGFLHEHVYFYDISSD